MDYSTLYLFAVLEKYRSKYSEDHILNLIILEGRLKQWAGDWLIEVKKSGSCAKGTAISLSSDIDYFVSVHEQFKVRLGGLERVYDSLYDSLRSYGYEVRKQNVSSRVFLGDLKIDVTPGSSILSNAVEHSIYVSKIKSWRKTNVDKHIDDISKSRRLNEIKLIKIWRELHQLEFPSIYLEYLVIDILMNQPFGSLESNFRYTLSRLSDSEHNPLFFRVADPASPRNILSDLLDRSEKDKIIFQAQDSINKPLVDMVW